MILEGDHEWSVSNNVIMWKELAMDYLKVLAWHSAGEIKGNYKSPQ
jgi:hypothetical protein